MFQHNPTFFVAAALILTAVASPAEAVITRLTPLKAIIDDSDFIVVLKVDSIDPARPSMTLTLGDVIKGETAMKSMAVLLKGDSEGNPKQVLDRVAAGHSMVVFITELPDRRLALAFSNGSWFQIVGQLDGDKLRWEFTHGEPYLRRTFKGSTDEIKQAVVAYVTEKKEPPPVSGDEKPGLGPVLPGAATTATTPEATTDAKSTTTPIASAPQAAPAPAPKQSSFIPILIAVIVGGALAGIVYRSRKGGG